MKDEKCDVVNNRDRPGRAAPRLTTCSPREAPLLLPCWGSGRPGHRQLEVFRDEHDNF